MFEKTIDSVCNFEKKQKLFKIQYNRFFRIHGN